MFKIDDRTFDVVRGSDIVRDGMYLEMSETGAKAGVAEIFYADQNHKFVLNTFGNDVPLEALEWLIAKAKEMLP